MAPRVVFAHIRQRWEHVAASFVVAMEMTCPLTGRPKHGGLGAVLLCLGLGAAPSLPALGCAGAALSCLQPHGTASRTEDAPGLVLFPRLQLLHGARFSLSGRVVAAGGAGTSQRLRLCPAAAGVGWGGVGARPGQPPAGAAVRRPWALPQGLPIRAPQHPSIRLGPALLGPSPRPQRKSLSQKPSQGPAFSILPFLPGKCLCR